MKRLLLILKLFLLGCLLFIVISLVMGRYNLPGFTFFHNNDYSDYELVEGEVQVDGVDLEEVTIYVVAADIEILPTNGDIVTVEYDHHNNVKLYYQIDGDNLLIESDANSGVNFGFGSYSKEGNVVVKIPSNLLYDLTINNVSSDIHVAVDTNSTDFNTVSGDIELENKTKKIKFNSVSGNLIINAFENTEIDANTVSGDIHYTGPAYNLDINSINNNSDETNDQATVEIKFKSVSGSLKNEN